MSVEHLRTGDRANVRFRFIKSPEYLRLGMKLVFREGRTKAIGTISKLYPHIAPQTLHTRGKTKLQTTTGAIASSNVAEQMQSSKRNGISDDSIRSGSKRSKQVKATTDNISHQDSHVNQNTS